MCVTNISAQNSKQNTYDTTLASSIQRVDFESNKNTEVHTISLICQLAPSKVIATVSEVSQINNETLKTEDSISKNKLGIETTLTVNNKISIVEPSVTKIE
jgi:hypothetical protein